MAPRFSACQIFFPDVSYEVNGIDLCNSVDLFENDKDYFKHVNISREGILKTFGDADSCATLSQSLADELTNWSFRFISTLFVPTNREVSVHNFGSCEDNIWDYFLSDQCWENFDKRVRFASLCRALDIPGLEIFENRGPKCMPYFQWRSAKENKNLQCGFKTFMEKVNENKTTPFDVLTLVYSPESWPFGNECDTWIKEEKFKLGVFLIPTCDSDERKIKTYNFRKFICLKKNHNFTTSLRFLNEKCDKGYVTLT